MTADHWYRLRLLAGGADSVWVLSEQIDDLLVERRYAVCPVRGGQIMAQITALGLRAVALHNATKNSKGLDK